MSKCSRWRDLLIEYKCPSALQCQWFHDMVYHLVPVSVSAMMAIVIPIIGLLVTDGGWHADCRRVC